MHRQLPLLNKKSGTALVLSGGATKAFYFHIGVLKVLQLHDVSSIVGTSAGAVAGALLASGITVDSLIASLYSKEVYIPRYDRVVKTLTSTMVLRPQFNNIAFQGMQTALASLQFALSLPFMFGKDIVAEILDRILRSQRHAPSFFTAEELESLFRSLLPSNDFNDTDIDLYVTATSLDSHERAVFNGLYDFENEHNHFMTDVPIHKAVRASSAVPGLFEPVRIKNRYYIDGEIRQTLSMDIALALADKVIISHTYQPLCTSGSATVRNLGWLNILRQSLHIALYERILSWRSIYGEQYPEKEVLWIQPDSDDEEFFLAPEFSFRPEVQKALIASGERAALKALEQEERQKA